ncbi:histidine kinase [Bosea sp. 685]|uniref:histidine kinase n=1 Tax=Bosea sp. 685 TaxID=3080057 RepID=UPI0028935C61|nr:histidine kinase [Bosea sp. 685]WNJ91375.1 histidine kinase [Bosea sp. 685]
MADFYPILARAIAGLPDKSSAARRAVYDRARTALVAQLRSLDPPLGEAEIMRERLSLDEAVAKIEADYGEGPAQPPAQAGPVFRPAVTPEPARREVTTPPAAITRAEPEPEQNQDDGRFEDPLPEVAEQQAIRPRVAPRRERRVNPGHVRTAIVGGGVAIAVAAIAAAAYYVNKIRPPENTARSHVETPAQPPQPDAAGKLNDRVGDAGAPSQTRPNSNAGTPAQGSEVAVAQRAILYTEVAESPQQPRALNGRVFWRLDSESAGPGRPVETIVRATIEVPEAGIGLDFTIRRNTDTAFPASHIIGLRFTSTGTTAPEAIREVGVPQFKTDENERGAPLSAINSALGENLFVAALSNVPVEVERNLDLILNRNWIDVPIRFASGKRGILTFEKGFPGSQTLADAFGRWR